MANLLSQGRANLAELVAMHPSLLIFVYLLILLSPLGLSALQELPPRPVLDDLSSGLGMSAFAALLVEFVLSGRFRAVSSRAGLDMTMRFHQLTALIILLFVLIHPLLYSTPMMNEVLPWDPSGQLTLGMEIDTVLSGVAAWVLLAGFVLISIFRDQLPYSYETWRAIHALGATLIALLITHHTLFGGRYSQDPILTGFWLVLLCTAIGSLVWTYIVSPLASAPYSISSIKRVGLKIWEVSIRPMRGDALQFKAGQFVWLNIGHGPFSKHENPFSISSAPSDLPSMRFLIKEAGDMTRQLGSIPQGASAYVDGPHGNFTMEGRSGLGVALIGGGVGIAPLLSITNELTETEDARPVVVLYGNRVAEQIVQVDALSQIEEHSNLRVHYALSEPPEDWDGLKGKLDEQLIKQLFSFPEASKWLYFVCGPPAMMEIVERSLINLGIPSSQIVMEQFRYD